MIVQLKLYLCALVAAAAAVAAAGGASGRLAVVVGLALFAVAAFVSEREHQRGSAR